MNPKSKAFDKNKFLIEFIEKLKNGELVEPVDMCGWPINEVRAVAFAIEQGGLAGSTFTGQNGLIDGAGLIRLNAYTDEFLATLRAETRSGKTRTHLKAFAKWALIALGSLVVAVVLAWALKKLKLKD
ncbi:MAG TPA: hypothetical protein VNT99_13740 [Methylomirabilota bacterium]|nr:hypothetical protein [Methylomirabilota bacterium]